MKFTIPLIIAVLAVGAPAAPTPVSLNSTLDVEIQNLYWSFR